MGRGGEDGGCFSLEDSVFDLNYRWISFFPFWILFLSWNFFGNVDLIVGGN